jgi:hypothetical protein
MMAAKGAAGTEKQPRSFREPGAKPRQGRSGVIFSSSSFASMRLPDGSFQLTLIGQTNQSYTLEVSTNLATWNDWTNVAPVSFSTPLTDPAAAHDPHRFYLARTR